MSHRTVDPALQNFWEQLLSRYQHLNHLVRKGQTVFAGSSLMEQFPVNELMQSLQITGCVYNRGIGGYTTWELLEHMDTCIFDLDPKKLFLNIGTNDIGAGDIEGLTTNYRKILTQIKERLPQTQLYLLAYYPCNPDADFGIPNPDHKNMFRFRTNSTIKSCNEWVSQLAEEFGAEYLNLNAPLIDEQGRLREELSTDGIHLHPDAYAPLLQQLAQYL